jgi:hypothetical protein
VSVPPEEPGTAAEAAGERECPRCGSAAAPHQDYCLECGAPLPPPDPAAVGPTARAQGGARESVLTVLVAFLVAVLAAAAVVGVQLARDDTEHPFFVATNEQGLAEPEQEELPPVETALPPDEEEELPPDEEEPPLEEPEPEPEPEQQELVDWPADVDGWTVILASVPTADGREAATVRARQARDAGLPEVGVLTSAEFASLHPGYFIVFSGVFETQAEAQTAVPSARDAGFGDAYPRQITR